MLNVFKQVFKSTNKDLRGRVIFTLVCLIIYCLGNTISVPGAEKITGDLGFLELLNSMTGGGLKNFSIFAVGVMPYITASIAIQLLSMKIMGISYFQELKERGEEGRRKMNQITRYAGIAFAFIQGYVFSVMFLGNSADPMRYLEVTVILTAGTAFLLWLGDQITSKGIGNGISLIIMAGIVSRIPIMFQTAFESLIPNASNTFIGILTFSIFVIIYLAIIVGVIFVQQAERRLPIQHSNRSAGSMGTKQSYLPLKLNSANVIPVIFASAIIGVPTTLAYFTKSDTTQLFINKYLSYTSVTGFIIYMALIFIFVYIYTYASMNPEEMSKNLNKSGGYIPGVRPGKETKGYISKVLGRITFMGAIFLALIAALPILFTAVSGLPSTVTVGGTGLLIAVGVALETYKQLESSVASRNYNRR